MKKPFLIGSLILAFLFAAPTFFPNYAFSASSIHLVTTIPLGDQPAYSVYNPSNKYIYVINTNSDYGNKNGTVSVIDGITNKVVATVRVGLFPEYITYVPSSQEVWVSSNDNIYILKGIAKLGILGIPSSSYPGIMAYNPSNKYVYVVIGNGGVGSSGVDVYNSQTHKLVSFLATGPCCADGIIYNPSNQEMYVTNSENNCCKNNFVTLIKGIRIVSTVQIGTELNGNFGMQNFLAYDPANHGVYLLGASAIPVINSSTNKVVAMIHITSGRPQALLYDPANKNMYVTTISIPGCCWFTSVAVINSATNKLSIAVRNYEGFSGFQISYDFQNRDIYVPVYNENTNHFDYVIVVSSQTNKASAVVQLGGNGGAPVSSLYDPSNSKVYISESFGNSAGNPGEISVVSSS